MLEKNHDLECNKKNYHSSGSLPIFRSALPLQFFTHLARLDALLLWSPPGFCSWTLLYILYRANVESLLASYSLTCILFSHFSYHSRSGKGIGIGIPSPLSCVLSR